MTIEETIKGMKCLKRNFSGYKPNEEMFDKAIKALELMDLLTDRPCGICKYHEHGLCTSWDCPFEEIPEEAKDG